MDSKRKIKLQIFISFLAGAAVVLGISHHTMNFWGLGFLSEAAILVAAVPILAFLVFLFLNRAWEISAAIEKKRWLLFLFPALIVSAVLTWQFHYSPSVWHKIEIIPVSGRSAGQIELYEIKYPPGRTIKFSKMAAPKGWAIEGDVLKTVSANPAPLEYSFFSPIGEPTSLLFLRSPNSWDVTVILDGKKLEVELYHQNTSQMSVEVDTSYKMGIPGGIILFLITMIDFLFFFFFILFAWLIQEISQSTSANEEKQKLDERFLSHRTGITVLLVLACLLHTLNFFAVPLIIGPDSPSYLVGALHWMQYHNLDGVPAARGPMTTFLFIPAFLLFGKNPWGVKIILHLLAIACIPVMYGMGWQLFKRRSFAFCSGLIAVLMPEMYLYSNIVMSDVPNMFFTLAFCALLILALETFSSRDVIIVMQAGSMAALLRPENMVLPVIAAGFLFLKIAWKREDVRKRLQILGVACLLALIPLLAWSAHNKRAHGFFGLSDYAGVIWYDGWIYYGEASGIHITDPESPAVQAIEEAVRAYDKPINYVRVPTSLELYPALLEYGYTEKEALKLLEDAAKDSVRNDPRLALKLYIIKIKKSFFPDFAMKITFTPPERNSASPQPDFRDKWTVENFDKEKNVFPALIPWQRKAYDWLATFDDSIYRPLVLFCLGVALLAIYQKQFFKWMPITVIAASRLFIPITIGLGIWRYMLSGIVLLLIFFLLAIQIMRGFLSAMLNPKTG